jgi:hypothetical protein
VQFIIVLQTLLAPPFNPKHVHPHHVPEYTTGAPCNVPKVQRLLVGAKQEVPPFEEPQTASALTETVASQVVPGVAPLYGVNVHVSVPV